MGKVHPGQWGAGPMSELKAALELSRWSELAVRGEPGRLEDLLDRMEASLPAGWVRDRASEQRVRDAGAAMDGARCYARLDDSGRPETALWLVRPRSDVIGGGMVVPLRPEAMSVERSAAAITDFLQNVLTPAARADGMRVEHRPGPHPIESTLPPEAVERLHAFAGQAVKETWPLRTEDRRLWHAFVISAHLSGATVRPEVLADWLTRQGWCPDRAAELAGEYADVQWLLSEYDETRPLACR